MERDEEEIGKLTEELQECGLGDVEKMVDITEEFLTLCKEIPFGELAMARNFHLSEAMSAIELMDPKMDVGLVKVQDDMGFEKCRQKGAFAMGYAETLATLDASLCGLVTWLEGNSLAQTIFTNVLLTEPTAVDLPILGSFGHATNLLVHYIIYIVSTAGVFDEEDFNSVLVYQIKFQHDSNVVLAELQNDETTLIKESKNSPDDQPIMKAIAARLGFMRTFIQSLLFLTPAHAVFGVDDNLNNFRPKIRLGIDSLKTCLKYAEKMAATWKLGALADEGDGDFGWLPAFEPDYNRKYLPATFPRKSEMISRERTSTYLVDMIQCLMRLPMELSEVINDTGLILDFVRGHSEEKFSTVFTRSFLQMVLFPIDDHVLGDRPLAAIFIDTLKNAVSPPFLDPCIGVTDEEDIQNRWHVVMNDFVRVLLSIIQAYGSNLPRQREKLVPCIEELCIIESEADTLDTECFRFFSGEKQMPSFNHRGGLHVATFVINDLLRLVCVHLEHSFRLELIAPYEYTYMYWYLGEVGKKWLSHGLERAHNFLIQDQRASASPEKKKGSKKTAVKIVKKEERLNKRIQMYKDESTVLSVETSICDGMFRATIGLALLEKIEVPMWNEHSEELRFAHRMAPFAQLYSLFNFDYKTYKQRSRFESLASAGPVQLLIDAAESFDMARIQLERSRNVERFASKAQSMMKVCKNNIIVLRILATGLKQNNRIAFDFTESPIYPMIRLQS